MAKIICVDFDGVLHSYKSGWKGPRNIPDEPVPGAIEWLASLIDDHRNGGFDVQIFSSRSRYWGGRRAMKKWLSKYAKALGMNGRWPYEYLKFPTEKPPAHVTLDDRAICFTGIFPTKAELANFKPWNKQ